MPTRWYRHYLPLFPAAIEQFDLDDADLIVSTSHCAAKAVVPTGRARHVCYCHSPMRYAWDQFDAYFGPARSGGGRARCSVPSSRGWRGGTRQRSIASISFSPTPPTLPVGSRGTIIVRRRSCIRRSTRRSSRPARVLPISLTGCSLVGISARAAYSAWETGSGRRPTGGGAADDGAGPDEARLRAIAGPEVEFLGAMPPERLREDTAGPHRVRDAARRRGSLGIAPVEAMACGRPVMHRPRRGLRDRRAGDRDPGSEATAEARSRRRGM